MANFSTSTGVDREYSVYVGNLNPSTTLSDMEDLIYELFLQVSSQVQYVLYDFKYYRALTQYFCRLVHWIRCSSPMTKTQGSTRAMVLLNSYTRSLSNTQLT